MEEKVKSMLTLIEEDADTFAKKAEMYYKRRPELITFVQETYKSYRALAERYDHISGELHKANNTIATVFPDQVHFGIDDEDEDTSPKASPVRSEKARKASPPPADRPASTLDRSTRSLSVQKPPRHGRTSSQLSKEKAQEEIDQLQKGILSLQTEKEFIKSSYESGLAKYWDIEKRITEMQERVCTLQDEFSADTVIEDDEARALMAVTALKSCEDTLVSLHQQQKRSSEEARFESRRIRDAKRQLRALKCQYGHLRADSMDLLDASGESSADENLGEEAFGLKERLELQSVCEKVRENFEMNSEKSVLDLAEKIDGLVNKVISLETTVQSQTAQIQRLRMETDDLQKHLQSLEEEKMSLIDGSRDLTDKLRHAEEELRRLQDLDRCVRDEGGKLQMHFTEACHTFNDLSDQLQSPRQHNVGAHGAGEEQEKKDAEREESRGDDHVEREIYVTEEVSSKSTPDIVTEKKSEDEEAKQMRDCIIPSNDDTGGTEGSHETRDSPVDVEQKETTGENQDSQLTNWQQLFLLDELEDREKILLAEYSSMLRNYRETRRKLTESEKKNQDNFFDAMAQMRDLKNMVVMKDEEIHSLRQKLAFVEASWKENPENDDDSHATSTSSKASELRTLRSACMQNPELPRDESAASPTGDDKGMAEGNKSRSAADRHRSASAVEEKFRKDIDELLGENLEFWLRFSSSFQQIQSYQMAVQDLQSKIMKLKDRKKQEGGSTSSSVDHSLKSKAMSVYRQLKELQTDLSVWTEQNALLKQELQSRFSSLCNIREEISRVSKDQVQFTAYQASKFQGEVVNMQQENNKVADELQTGLDHVKELQVEVEKALVKLEENFDLSAASSKGHHSPYHHFRNLSTRARIPLRSFLFGVKPKKPSIFSCMNPALQKQYSDLRPGPPH